MKQFIKADEIPYKELKKTLGMSESDFLNLPTPVLDKMLSGRLSPLMHLKIDTGKHIAEGLFKMALVKDEKNRVNLRFYPMEKNLKYDQKLESEESQRLKKGEAVLKTVVRNGVEEKMLIQLDRETNNIIEMKASAIRVPDSVAGVTLGGTQKQRIREGKPVEIDKDNTKVTVGVDLDDVTNFRVLDGSLKEWYEQKLMKWDRLNRGVATGWWKTSENLWQLKQFNLDRDFGQELSKGHGVNMHYGMGIKRG